MLSKLKPPPQPSPSLNGPYDEPAHHYATGEDGSLDYERPLSGRPPQASMFDVNEVAAQYCDQLFNLARERVTA